MSELTNPVPTAEACPVQVVPRFEAINGRRLFSLMLQPEVPAIGTVLYLPPMAEEMNRCRSHVADAARALAARGWRCVLLDPYATGESEGDSEAADWDIWAADTATLAERLAAEHGPIVLWGVRSGALLAAEAAGRVPQHVQRLLFWQPVLDGSLFLNQTLRLRIASQMVHDGAKESTDGLRRQLAEGHTLEVAGYPLPGRLAMALNERKLAALCQGLTLPVSWMEVVTSEGAAPSPASRKAIDAWPVPVALHTVVCPMVWQVHGREEAPGLVDATLRLLQDAAP